MSHANRTVGTKPDGAELQLIANDAFCCYLQSCFLKLETDLSASLAHAAP